MLEGRVACIYPEGCKGKSTIRPFSIRSQGGVSVNTYRFDHDV